MARVQAFYKITGVASADGVKLRLTTNYSEIATVLGLTSATATDPGEPISGPEAVSRRFGSWLRITVKVGARKRTSHHIFCAADQEDTALKNLIGKNFNGLPIVGAGYVRHAVFY